MFTPSPDHPSSTTKAYWLYLVIRLLQQSHAWPLYVTSAILYIASYPRGYEPCWALVSNREASKQDKFYCTDFCISTIILLWDVEWNRDKHYRQCECSFCGKSHTYHNEQHNTKPWVPYVIQWLTKLSQCFALFDCSLNNSWGQTHINKVLVYQWKHLLRAKRQ